MARSICTASIRNSATLSNMASATIPHCRRHEPQTLAHRVAHLIQNGSDPQRLLLLTFTRRAAPEIYTTGGVESDRLIDEFIEDSTFHPKPYTVKQLIRALDDQ
jgi:hypothetical protein